MQMQHKRKRFFLCPKCGEYGYLGRGWIAHARGTRYHVNYIRHYNPEKYHRQMERYRNHEIKSRPNGQKRCYVPNAHFRPINDEYSIMETDGVSCGSPDCRNGKHKLPLVPRAPSWLL